MELWWFLRGFFHHEKCFQNTNLEFTVRALWRSTNLQESALERPNKKTQQKDHEDHFAGKEGRLSHYTFIPMSHAMEIQDAKAAFDKEWESFEKLPAWQMTKVMSRKRGHSRGTERREDSSFCFICGHMSSQKCGVGAKIFEVQIRALMSYVPEQGSSASQMTATKVMDVISRLPDCAGQAADAVSVYRSTWKMLLNV